MPERAVHFGLRSRAGWGGIGAVTESGINLVSDGILILAPEATVELNVLPFMKAQLGAGYRAVFGANNPIHYKPRPEFTNRSLWTDVWMVRRLIFPPSLNHGEKRI